ncbi:MAG: DNA-processing protein DprA [Lachnospiraceae bacterium]|nr:DNA-processing protein DprA [Lachnospiraceae bacterium]
MGIFKQSVLKEYEIQMPYLMWMSASSCIGIKTYTRLQSFFASPKEFYEGSGAKWEKCKIFTKKQIELLSEAKRTKNPQTEYEAMIKKGINIVSIEEEIYPEKLREIKDAPISLFYKGRLPEKNVPQIAVIGARACTNYGLLVAKRLGESLAFADMGVISGMARGIDAEAQTSAVVAGGYSLAVLGTGPDIIYPRESKRLYEMLERGGGIISEYAPGMAAKPANFALRNRIISGLSDVICVVEAKEKSGTMITIDCALEQGREVYVVPGRITDAVSIGCLEMIKQGAGVVTGISEFVDEIRSNYRVDAFTYLESKSNEAFSDKISSNGKYENAFSTMGENFGKIVLNLPVDSFNVDEIIVKTGLDYGEVLLALLSLEKEKMVNNLGAGRFSINKPCLDLIDEFRKNFLAS